LRKATKEEQMGDHSGLAKFLEGYDVLLFGDGSGINREGAWAVVMLNQIDGTARLFMGGVSRTTINVMELIGYLHALSFLQKERYRREGRKISVLILSDSSVTVNCGNGEHTRKANRPFWAALDAFSEDYDIEFMLIPRNSLGLNAACDTIAGNLRRILVDLNKNGSEQLRTCLEEATFDAFAIRES
jgi:ribonuclease HI